MASGERARHRGRNRRRSSLCWTSLAWCEEADDSRREGELGELWWQKDGTGFMRSDVEARMMSEDKGTKSEGRRAVSDEGLVLPRSEWSIGWPAGSV